MIDKNSHSTQILIFILSTVFASLLIVMLRLWLGILKNYEATVTKS